MRKVSCKGRIFFCIGFFSPQLSIEEAICLITSHVNFNQKTNNSFNIVLLTMSLLYYSSNLNFSHSGINVRMYGPNSQVMQIGNFIEMDRSREWG